MGIIDRRKHPRYRLMDQFTMMISIDGLEWDLVEACDISFGGTRFISKYSMAITDDILIKIINTSIDDDNELLLKGHIVWEQGEFSNTAYGVQFEVMIDDEYEQLNKLVGFVM